MSTDLKQKGNPTCGSRVRQLCVEEPLLDELVHGELDGNVADAHQGRDQPTAGCHHEQNSEQRMCLSSQALESTLHSSPVRLQIPKGLPGSGTALGLASLGS